MTYDLPAERDRWEDGREGDCCYCGRSTVVQPEPFFGQESCRDCFNKLAG